MGAADRAKPLRLFLALELEAGTREALAAWASGLVAGERWRPVGAEALHITLVFLGATPPGRVDGVWGAVREGARELGEAPPPLLTPAGVRAVPRRRPRLLALALEDLDGRAGALQGAVARRLAEAGLHEPERRPFWPHLTLVRARRGARGVRVRAGAPPVGSFSAPVLTLYSSLTAAGGARYTALERLELPG